MFRKIKKEFTMQTDTNQEISFIDVKALYDAAYEEKAKAAVDLYKFNALMAEAESLANAYRQQLAQKAMAPFSYRRAA